MTADQSAKLLRLYSIFKRALDLFERNAETARQWLTIPKKALGKQTPLAYSQTELGAHEVENLLGRLEHGVFS
jgi:putative toxin-antitoxin system antitoxin component (TIGR02293 family)